MDVEQKTLEILSEVTGNDAVKREPDVELYEGGLMDSMTTVQLIAALSEQFNLEISPAEFDREAWATPRLLVADIQRRCHP
jgi:D-alanine--poly(phosphoribitol) ligase subunit 2